MTYDIYVYVCGEKYINMIDNSIHSLHLINYSFNKKGFIYNNFKNIYDINYSCVLIKVFSNKSIYDINYSCNNKSLIKLFDIN